MHHTFKKCLLKNFLAAIDMFKNIIVLCPDKVWKQDKKFFYLTYHTAVFLDYYLSNPVKEFYPSLPYTILDSLPPEAVDDVIPDKFYTKEDLVEYVSVIRKKCQNLIQHASDEKLDGRWIKDEEISLHGMCPTLVSSYTLMEILFYNLRHLQHHAGQLNLLLRQQANLAADWISQAEAAGG
jgi:hypothetical protein